MQTSIRKRRVARPPADGRASQRARQTRRIIGRILHHITQPLTALRGTLDVGLLPGHSREDLEQAARASLAIVQYLTDDFELLKEAVESDDPGEGAEDVQWPELIRRAVAESVEELGTKKISVSFRLTETSHVHADPDRLLKATKDCLRLGITLSPAGSGLEAILERQGRELVLTIRHSVNFPPSAKQDESDPGSFPEEEIRAWILNRIVEAQGGTFGVEMSLSGKRSLHIHMPVPAAAGRSRLLRSTNHKSPRY